MRNQNSSTAIAPASVIVNANKTLTLAAGSKLLIDLKHYKLLVKQTGGVLIKKGATLRQVKAADTSGGANIAYVLTDHLGSTNVTTDDSGNILELSDYYPYGSIRIDEGSSKEQRKYIGEEYDAYTGLNYLNARYYNSKVGQFISQDPVFWEIGQTEDGKKVLINPQAQNSYSYATGNPVTLSDPQGRISPCLLCDIAIGLFIPNVAYSPAPGEENQVNVALERKLMLMSFASPMGEANGVKNIVVNNADDAIRIISNETRILTNAERQGVSNIIENQTLKNIFNTFFKESDKFPGGTAGALQIEKATGKLLSRTGHMDKAQGFLNGLNKILNNAKVNSKDKSIANALLNQLKKVLKNGK